MSDSRSRAWSFIVYPEDRSYSDCVHDLDPIIVPYAVSPLHSLDSKPHFHVLVRFDGKKSFSQCQALFPMAANGYFEPVDSVGAYFCYLIHYYNPEKEQFSKDFNLIICRNGFPAAEYIPHPDDVEMMRFLTNLILRRNIISLAEFSYLVYNFYPGAAGLLSRKTQYFMRVIESLQRDSEKSRSFEEFFEQSDFSFDNLPFVDL